MLEITPWDGRPLDAAVIGLSWPGPDDPAGHFTAAGGGRVVLVPDDRRGDFFDAHPQAGIAADLIAVPRPFAAAIDPIIAAGRLYDVALFKSLVKMGKPDFGERQHVPGVPAGWGGRSEERRVRAGVLRTHADGVIRRVGVDPKLVARFGPLGLGIEVRAAAAARAGGAELKVLDGRLAGLRAKIELRRAAARKAFDRFPAVKSLANQSGGAHFLRTGRPGVVNAAALATLVGALRGQLRRRDALPVATPEDPTDLHAWELLAAHHPVLAAWVELSAAVELADSLEAGGGVRTRVLTFPELRTTGPDLGYLRRLAGPGALAPAGPGRKLLIADIPGLELRCLAACLGRTFEDFELTRLIDTSGTEGVRHEIARRLSGLGEDEYLRLAVRTDPAVAGLTGLAEAALKYFPRGVANRDLETWLTEFEYGVKPTARQVAAAWRAIVDFAPSLPRYCSADGAALVSANLGATAAELRAAVAGRRVGGGDGCDLETLVGVLATGTASAGATVAQAVAFFTSPDGFPNGTLPANLESTPGALAGALLASDHATPTGRVYGAAMPIQAFGTDHTGLADAVRKEVLSALVASGLDVAGFAGDAFAAVVPADDPARREAVRNLVIAAVRGVLPDFREGVYVSVMDAW